MTENTVQLVSPERRQLEQMIRRGSRCRLRMSGRGDLPGAAGTDDIGIVSELRDRQLLLTSPVRRRSRQ
jgi:hypothetical protein